MTPHVRSVDRLLWLGLGLTTALLLLAALLAALRWEASQGKPLPVLGQVAPFSLTNQEGKSFTLTNLAGRVWVADLIFTRCAGPCLKMSRQMKELQDALPASSRARLVSLTTDPDYDSPAVLRTYGQRFGSDPQRWTFLTGAKPQIANLATNSLKLVSLSQSPDQRASPADLFIHSTIFVVVDKAGRLRGTFETSGEEIEPQQVKARLLAAVRRLERER